MTSFKPYLNLITPKGDNHLIISPPLTTITLGVGASAYEVLEDANIRPVTTPSTGHHTGIIALPAY